MFGTIIQDAYTKSQTKNIVAALDELCNPNDSYGWASAGIYTFWNYYSRELLYIGLAVDLTERFQQHNGLIRVSEKGCKINEINQYFKEYDKLGYSVFVQSPLSQPVINKNIYKWHKFDPQKFGIKDFTYEQSKQDLRVVEGILIEAYRRRYGKYPPWNRMGGSREGQKRTTVGNYNIVDNMTSNNPSILNARYSLRELAANPTYERYENFLHGVRMMMLFFGMEYESALKLIRKGDILNTYEEMVSVGHFKKLLNI
ncbi:GIY-YIG nuclease family protein [Lysinibacillus sphaericus]|uniref:GIY-YIG nuclease family protein n=1 Tax=Lysinibacillus sphaericus TaxID=1421 RepID=UPI0025A028A8|nr:GIY-YIG nuclease family protein [Lysinibacillus sphaericus]MDM5351949.1 GIY-YIG nuclease family protein [Lysinibacillus sphaericus]